MPDGTTRVALIGAGNISRRYLEGMARFPQLEVIGVTDALPAAAATLSEEASIHHYQTVDELLADADVDVVVNITPPNAHADVTVAALQAGKNVYVEKPLAVTREDAARMRAAADATGLVLGSAPDTFLGSAAQTARKAIDDGLIGGAVAAAAFITSSKAELWHPNPSFLFAPGGGPLLDLGPYYITALVNLLGPIRQVSGATMRGPSPRPVTAPTRTVDQVEVATTTHATAILTFESGVVGTLIASFDIWDSGLPRIEVYGSEGTLNLPDPNEFDGPVRLHRKSDGDWETLDPVLPPTGDPGTPTQLLRGVGVADLAASLQGGPLRVSSALAEHVLEVLTAVETSSERGTAVEIDTRPARPTPRNIGESVD